MLAAEFAGEGSVQGNEFGRRRPVHQEVREIEEPGKLANRVGVIVHPQIDPPIVATAVAAAFADDEESRRLTAASIAARGIGCPEAGDQQLRERETPGLERSCQPVHDRRTGENVALGGIVDAGSPTGPGEA